MANWFIAAEPDPVQKLNWRVNLTTPYWSAVMRRLADRLPQENLGHGEQLVDGSSR